MPMSVTVSLLCRAPVERGGCVRVPFLPALHAFACMAQGTEADKCQQLRGRHPFARRGRLKDALWWVRGVKGSESLVLKKRAACIWLRLGPIHVHRRAANGNACILIRRLWIYGIGVVLP